MASSEPPDSKTDHPVLRVAYDYEYDYKTRKVSIRQGEILELLQKTNEHWWKVMRPIINKPFFVPAQYVFPVDDDKNRNETGKESHAAFSNNNKSPSSSNNNNNNNQSPVGADKGESSKKDDDVGRANESAYFKASAKTTKLNRNEATRASHRDRAQSKLLSSSSTKISSLAKLKNWTSSLEELSKQIVFPGIQSESIADLTAVTRDSVDPQFLSVREKDISKDSSSVVVSSSGSKLESINKCLSFRNPGFNNHVDSSGNVEPKKESSNLQKSAEENLQTQNVKTMECSVSRSGTITKNSKPPPLPKSSPVRILPDNWGEYYSPDCGRYFYYNEETNVTSWKPPRNSSSKKFDEHLGSSLSDASAHASSFEMSLENIPDCVGRPEVGSPEAASQERRGSVTGRVSKESLSGRSKNLSTESVASKTQQSEDECNIHADVYPTNNIPVPVGWESCWEEASQQMCYVNKITGARTDQRELSGRKRSGSNKMESNRGSGGSGPQSANSHDNSEHGPPISVSQETLRFLEGIFHGSGFDFESRSEECSSEKSRRRQTDKEWFTSTDTQERIYFYEENSNNSSWFLPVPGVPISQSQRSTSRSLGTDSPDEAEVLQEAAKVPKGSVKKRHSAGEVAERILKTKSLLIPTDLNRKYGFSNDKSGSLPRSPKLSIWMNGRLNILREGPLSRTKITENGKKLRKSWGLVYAILTESHLSLFKDQKSFLAKSKTEIEMELEGATLEWTDDKSSRKNVFQLNTPSGLQMLFQLDDKDSTTEWFDDIRGVTEKSDQSLDISMRLRSTESPKNLLDPVIGERKISSRLNRNKSTKVRITAADDGGAEWNKISAHLKKFFNRRPPRESLVKKGIYKDESVFGCSLEKLCSMEKRDVPRFVEECIVAIESKDENLKTDGIYRASGNLSQVQKIRLQVDQNNMACLIQEEDVHVLAGCLKLFFRELKEPLIPYDLFEKALLACNVQNKKEKVNKFREIVHHLAKPNNCTLRVLLSHLLKISAFADFNRMQIPNLAIVFGPTLMWPAVESQNMALDLMQQNLVIEALLVEYDQIFQ